MKAVVEADGRIRLPDEIRDAAQLEAGQELEVTYYPGQLTLYPDDIPVIDETKGYSPEFLKGLDEAIAEANAGKGRFFASDEEWIAHLKATDQGDPR
ncbi:MAG: AbrB/MazE/SpoVT family DNA-binding domain-containing protein [Tepidiformaceae bacterium]